MVLGLGTWEIVVIALALLLLFGPEHVPQMTRKLGQWQGKARAMVRDMEETMRKEADEAERDLTKDGPAER